MTDRKRGRLPVPEAAVAGDWTSLGVLGLVAGVILLWRRRRRA
jgi:hypothetical protein